MRLSLLILGAVLCAGALAQQSGRERLRELVQRARAGDREARTILSNRRKKIIQQGGRGTAPPSTRAQEAVENILAGPAQSAAPQLSNRGSGRRVARPRNRARGQRVRQQQPRRPQPVATTPAPVEFTTFEAPVPTTFVNDAIFDEVFATTTAPRTEAPEPEQAPQTKQIPSLFQPAQFGAGARGVLPAAEEVSRPQPAPRQQPAPRKQPAPRQQAAPRQPRPESRQEQPEPRRQRVRFEPHVALQRGLETGSRSEFIDPQSLFHEENEEPRAPPVQTTRRYAYFDEAGNYIFGYEAEDGSFKEEIRGLDCIVNGKYGYVDPSGIRREFKYTSGNKCDPNDPEGLLAQEGAALNDQFLQQTSARQMNDAELASVGFNRRRQQAPQQQRSRPAPAPRAPAPRAPAPRAPAPRAPAPRAPAPRAPAPRAPEPTPTQQAPAQPNQERFPTPDFFNQQKPASRPKKPVPQEKKQESKPNKGIPSMFQPAQFGPGGRGVQAGASKPKPKPKSKPQSLPKPPKAKPTTPRPVTHAPPNLTPSKVIPSLFRPAQFGAGGRGVPPSPDTFDFQSEFSGIFNNFPGSQTPPSVRTVTTPRPTAPPRPRPTQAPRPAPRAPAPVPSHFQPAQSSIPAHFRPAQFAQNVHRPAPAPAPARAPVAAPARPASNNGGSGLVFDATTGQFKSVPLSTAQSQGRALPLFSQPRQSPLAPVPQTPSQFEHFFSNFQG